ncbi:MAG: hypothetical protein Q8P67_08275, partial [archaeon]|nr:hypothetical protein [archaeon]
MATHQCRFYRQCAALKEDEEKEIEFLHLSLDPSLSDAPYVLRAPSAVPIQLGRPPQETEASESQQEYPDHECSISQQLTGECLSTGFFSSDDGINMDLESNLETKTESELLEIDDFPDALKLILEMSSGGHILFIDHPLQLSFSNTTSILLSGLSSPSATFDQQPAVTVGAQIVDFGRTVVLSAGIDLAVEGFVPRNEREWSFQRAHRNVARPHHRWSGVRFRDRRSSGVQLVEAVSGVYLTTA